MSDISVNNLTFCYEGSFDNIFENVSFHIDTNWKLGFIGRNGKGKTTFLNLLLGKYEYSGSIKASCKFDYFPYTIKEEYLSVSASEFVEDIKSDCEQWKVICELSKLGADAQILYRPFYTLSFGERTKVLLAVLFSGENEFLLIDEPTNHLDKPSRDKVKEYLSSKKGFILVSHDRDLLDACIDHVLVLNRSSIEVQSGNFSTWWENKARQDAFAQGENEKHLREIGQLKEAAKRTQEWARKSEGTKIGFDPIKEHDRCLSTRSFIAAKTKKMQSQVKQMENRIDREITQKEGLLNDIETPVDLKIMPLRSVKNKIVCAHELKLQYKDAVKPLFENLTFELLEGERCFLSGENGCGKSSLIKFILSKIGQYDDSVSNEFISSGTLTLAPELIVSYVNQDTSFLQGSITSFCKERNLDESRFCAILRQLDMERVQFTKQMEDFSEGQKKKVLLAASILTPAHLYIWDEPLNYIDVFSRMQIEKLLLNYMPTMIIVEHDIRFRETIATQVVDISCH